MAHYGMSGTGGCPRALGAARQGLAPIPHTQDDLERLSYYTRLEAIAANIIEDEGFILEDGEICPVCQERYGITRHGIHVEYEAALFTLTGHLDRRIEISDGVLPVEIKSLGPNSFGRFKSKQFGEFANYAAQEACYLQCEGKPGFYLIMNRDTGETLRYLVNDFDEGVDLAQLPKGTTRIYLPITFDEIVDKLNDVEICLSESILPEGKPSNECWFCDYRFLCESKSKTSIITDQHVIQVAEDYKKANNDEKDAKSRKDKAKTNLIAYSIGNSLEKFQAGGISINYKGLSTKKWLDESILRREVAPEIIKLAERESDPYPNIYIRELKQK
jgi:hypothetical protein